MKLPQIYVNLEDCIDVYRYKWQHTENHYAIPEHLPDGTKIKKPGIYAFKPKHSYNEFVGMEDVVMTEDGSMYVLDYDDSHGSDYINSMIQIESLIHTMLEGGCTWQEVVDFLRL